MFRVTQTALASIQEKNMDFNQFMKSLRKEIKKHHGEFYVTKRGLIRERKTRKCPVCYLAQMKLGLHFNNNNVAFAEDSLMLTNDYSVVYAADVKKSSKERRRLLSLVNI